MSKFVIIDGHALIYRAYHAFPGLTSPSGQLVNAVYGFSRILLAGIRDLEPEYIAVAFDHKGKTNREKEFAEYKAQRPSMPDDLIPQIEIIKRVVDALNIPRFELEGYEADDLIGTIANDIAGDRCSSLPVISTAEKRNGEISNQTKDSSIPLRSTQNDNLEVETIIITGDKDLLQLVREGVKVYMPGRSKDQGDIMYEREQVYNKLGVYPEQVVDLKALMGDASDNIPGVRGIGKKTAATLIQKFGTLDALYEAIEKETSGLKGAALQKLIDGKETAYLSQRLATIECNVNIPFELEQCRVTRYDKEKVSELFRELDFKSLIQLLPKDEFENTVQGALF